MNISSLKSSILLPISKEIEPFFTKEGFQYTYDPFVASNVEHETCLYDDELALIKRIELWTTPDVSLNGLIVGTGENDTLNVQYSTKYRSESGQVAFVWNLNKVVRSVELPETGLLSHVSKIVISGLTVATVQEAYESIENNYEKLDIEWKRKTAEVNEMKAELNELELKKQLTSKDIKESHEHLVEMENNINRKQQEQVRLDDGEKQLRFNLSILEDDIKRERTNLKEAEKESSVMNNKNVDAKEEIARLAQKINKLQLEKFRYSEDFDTFKQELSLQNTLFLALITFFMIIGSTIVYSLLQGSYDLLRSFNSGVNIYELILSRVPTVLIHSMVIFFLGKWINIVIQGLIGNLNDLKKLKQLVYLVTEVTESQAVGLDVHQDANVRYKQRVCEKMAIVRDALCIEPQHKESKSDDNNIRNNTSDFIVEAIKTVVNK
ncbi:hypothetical protein [Vibrio splendidus]|uniref:hypothetical protein n=1 Tax=Vibrio splendidus TaxID=29497 RepID=UPI00246924DA|nr:hypothetical protein [Vibrio splendidus]MDH5885444.1 hypothetical protein [Vibrio splendidus]